MFSKYKKHTTERESPYAHNEKCANVSHLVRDIVELSLNSYRFAQAFFSAVFRSTGCAESVYLIIYSNKLPGSQINQKGECCSVYLANNKYQCKNMLVVSGQGATKT